MLEFAADFDVVAGLRDEGVVDRGSVEEGLGKGMLLVEDDKVT